MNEPSFLRVRNEGGVARLSLDRPPLNVLDLPMLEEMRRAVSALSRDPDVRVLVLTGEGRAFCAGVDVADHTADRVDAMLDALHEVFQELLRCGAPVLAAVNGAALGGGCELLLACDVVLARAGAKIGQPEVRLGVFPPVAAAYLPRIVGPQAALDLILSGRTILAEEARELGLVTRVLPPDEFDAEVDQYAASLADLSGPVLRLAKRAVRDGLEKPATRALKRAESLYRHDLMRLEDAHEGLAAFLEKRAPVWKGA
jgi:cyclohexa-1,5-dienecarbonyl-CoA hydratase